MATDTLSDVLKTVRLTGAAYFDVVAQEPWSVLSPARELILPRILPGADHLIAYHVVTSGRAFAMAGLFCTCFVLMREVFLNLAKSEFIYFQF